MPDAVVVPQGTVQSALPPVMQRRLAALEAAETQTPPTPQTQQTPPANTQQTPPVEPPVTPPATTDTVTMTRAEFNELQAKSGKAQAAEARAETERMQREELAHRLTELEKTSKAVPQTPPAAALPVEDVTFTAEEEKDFGDSKEYIGKVVRQTLAPALRQINDLIAQLRTEVGKATQTASTAVTTVAQTQERTFFQQVNGAVPNLAEIKKHKHWPDFLDEVEGFSGATFEQLLAHNVRNQNLEGVKKIYNKFAEKYLQPSQSTATATAGYAGGVPSTATEPQTPPPEKMKYSDRKKASEDYRKNKITWDQLQAVNKKFEEAEKAGNVDYNS